MYLNGSYVPSPKSQSLFACHKPPGALFLFVFFFFSNLVKIIFDSLSYSWVLIKHTVFLESINYRIQWQFQINYTSFLGQEQRQSEKHYGKHFNIVTWPSGTIDTSVI
jgi:hypothetical protein